MFKAARLLFLFFFIEQSFALAFGDDTLFMRAKQIKGRMVFVCLRPPVKTWRIESEISVYIGTKRGDAPVRRRVVMVSAKDQKGHSIKVEAGEVVNDEGLYQHRPNQPDYGIYTAELKEDQQIASIEVKWKKDRQSFFISDGERNVDWDVARAWCGYVDPVGDLFTITLPDPVSLESLQVIYETDGQDKGHLNFNHGADGAVTFSEFWGKARKPKHIGDINEITFDLGHPKSLEAVVFHPDYETTSFYEPSLKMSGYKKELQPKPLPLVHLSGRIDSYEPVSADDPIVSILYVASLSIGLFHDRTVDRAVPALHVATVPLSPDGTFSADIHDFFSDPLFPREGPLPPNRLRVIVLSKKTGNDLLWLSTDPKDTYGNFPVQKAYPGVTTFYASKGPFKKAANQ